MYRHIEQFLIIAHENMRQRSREKLSQSHHYNSGAERKYRAFFAHVVKLRVILGAVVITHDRRGSDGVSDVYCRKYELHVHQHAIRGNSVLSGKTDELVIIQHADYRR